MNKHLLFLSILSLFLACHTPVNNTRLQGQLAEVDTIFADWTGARPGGAVGIIKDGRLLFLLKGMLLIK